jgi:tetratricopeptide (TPR) repeat protein
LRPSRAPNSRPSQDDKAAAGDLPLGAAAQILAQAEAAYLAGQATEASRHLKLLSVMTFNDARVQQRARELTQQVLRAAAVDFEKQAAQEERNKHWDRAAKTWLRVAEGRPQDGMPVQRAALAQLQAGVELRLVMETARRAVQLSPNDAQAHRTLAKVYLAADMKASADRELEAAKRCDPLHDPSDDTPTGLLKRLLGRDHAD